MSRVNPNLSRRHYNLVLGHVEGFEVEVDGDGAPAVDCVDPEKLRHDCG